jgi:hypothetical protein
VKATQTTVAPSGGSGPAGVASTTFARWSGRREPRRPDPPHPGRRPRLPPARGAPVLLGILFPSAAILTGIALLVAPVVWQPVRYRVRSFLPQPAAANEFQSVALAR